MAATGRKPRTTYFVNEHLAIYPNWPVWLNGSVFVYELSGCGFKSSCSHLSFRFPAYFKQVVPWVWIYSERRTEHTKNIRSKQYLHAKLTDKNHKKPSNSTNVSYYKPPYIGNCWQKLNKKLSNIVNILTSKLSFRRLKS